MKNNKSHLVKKDNFLIQKAETNMTYQEKKLLVVVQSRFVDLKNKTLKDIWMDLGDALVAMNVDPKSGYNMTKLIKTIDSFEDKAVYRWVSGIRRNGTPTYAKVRYFQKVEIVDDRLHMVWNEEIKPFIIGANPYTQEEAETYLQLKSSGSQDLYELLKSNENYESEYKKKLVFDLDYIKHTIIRNDMCTTKDAIRYLKRWIEDINKNTDLEITITTLHGTTNKRAISKVQFDIKNKKVIDVKTEENKDEQYEDYHGCRLTKKQAQELVDELHCKDLIIKLGNMKKQDKERYDNIMKTKHDDYELIKVMYSNREKKKGNLNQLAEDENINNEIKLVQFVPGVEEKEMSEEEEVIQRKKLQLKQLEELRIKRNGDIPDKTKETIEKLKQEIEELERA